MKPYSHFSWKGLQQVIQSASCRTCLVGEGSSKIVQWSFWYVEWNIFPNLSGYHVWIPSRCVSALGGTTTACWMPSEWLCWISAGPQIPFQIQWKALKLNLPKWPYLETPHGCNRWPSLCCFFQSLELYPILFLNLPLLFVIRLLIHSGEIRAMVKKVFTESNAENLETFFKCVLRATTTPLLQLLIQLSLK